MYTKCESFELGDTRWKGLRVPAHFGTTWPERWNRNWTDGMTEGNKSGLRRGGGDEWSKRGKSSPPPPGKEAWAKAWSIVFCLICPAFPIDRFSIQLLRNLSFRLAWTDQPIDRMGGICNAIWRAFCVLSCYVASGNSFNASLFLSRDYPKVVDCRRQSKKKRKKEVKEEKGKKVKTSWTSGRMLHHRREKMRQDCVMIK